MCSSQENVKTILAMSTHMAMLSPTWHWQPINQLKKYTSTIKKWA